MFFDNGWALLRVLIVGVVSYAALVLFVRVFGKRTLAKLNAFDLIVTVALGSALASTLLTEDVSLSTGLLALLLLIVLQFLVAWTSVRSRSIRRAVKSQATLVLYRGEFIPERMREQRITEGEIRAAARASGRASLAQIYAVVLETNGDLSVIGDPPPEEGGGTEEAGPSRADGASAGSARSRCSLVGVAGWEGDR
jgi:uncharacterized membrane protein YcaP (DUF421 family)